MIERFKDQLAIHIVWHPDFMLGLEVADDLYSYFSRDAAAPLLRGIGIPTYYRYVRRPGSPVPREINLAEADHNAIVVLIDDHLFNDDNWNVFVKALISKTNKKTRIFPIAFSDNAHFFEEETLGKEQFINATQIYAEQSRALREIRSRVLHGLCRLLLDKPSELISKSEHPPAVKLFISHAKKDSNIEAQKFRDYVQANSKLNTFFDANDIADGYRFDSQIKKAIENGQAALVVFHSDEYASREWCQIEVLTAKRYKSPIVVVHNIKKGEARSFPYLGNVPTIRYNEHDYDSVIDLTMYQILHNIYHRENLGRLKELYAPKGMEGIELASAPELFNYIDIINQKATSIKKKFLVLYPEPPLGRDEMRVLNDIDQSIQFLTPIQLSGMAK